MAGLRLALMCAGSFIFYKIGELSARCWVCALQVLAGEGRLRVCVCVAGVSCTAIYTGHTHLSLLGSAHFVTQPWHHFPSEFLDFFSFLADPHPDLDAAFCLPYSLCHEKREAEILPPTRTSSCHRRSVPLTLAALCNFGILY